MGKKKQLKVSQLPLYSMRDNFSGSVIHRGKQIIDNQTLEKLQVLRSLRNVF